MLKLVDAIRNTVNKNKIIRDRRNKINSLNLKIRLLESELLDPEFEYMKINKNGYLIKGWPIPMAMSMTRDKVAGASFDYGYKMMDKFPNFGWVPSYIAENEIYQRVGRRRVFSDKDIRECMKQSNVESCDEIYEYLKSIRAEWEEPRIDKLSEIRKLRKERLFLAPEEEFFE